MRRSFICAGLVLLGLEVIWMTGLRVNTSSSMPIGVWRKLPPPEHPLRGQTVIACITDHLIARMALERGYINSGACPNGTEPLLKQVAAVGGDVVSITEAGMSVNGTPLSNTAMLAQDPTGREMPTAQIGLHQLQLDEVWLVANSNPLSFDSRYYGAVRTADIKGIATPVLTWPGFSHE